MSCWRGLAVVGCVVLVGCNEPDQVVSGADSRADFRRDGPAGDRASSFVDLGRRLYPCKTPGRACNAHDPCAINTTCSTDKLRRPQNWLNCEDQLTCTVDECAGLGVCRNRPKPGFCVLGVRQAAVDGGVPDGSSSSGTTRFLCFKDGARNPNDPCKTCFAPRGDAGGGNATAWSPATGGACNDNDPCTRDDYCQNGTCKGTSFAAKCSDKLGCTTDLCDGKGGCRGNKLKAGWCVIDNTCHKAGAAHPSGTCFTCDPNTSTSSWTAVTNTCLIDKVCRTKGAKHPGGCAECDPSVSTKKWTVKGATHCLINNTCVASGKTDATGCQTCDPAGDLYGWTARTGVCLVAGKCYSAGAKHPGGCAECDPKVSYVKWTVKGTTHCLIADTCYPAGAKHSTGCATCVPTKDRYHWITTAGCCSVYLIEAEDSTKVTRTGTWSMPSGSVLHGGRGLEASAYATGEKLHFTIFGKGLTVYHTTGPNRGSFSVTIDGGAAKVFDTYKAGSFTFQVPTVVATGLILSSHKVQIEDVTPLSARRYLALDYFRVACK